MTIKVMGTIIQEIIAILIIIVIPILTSVLTIKTVTEKIIKTEFKTILTQ